MAMMLKRLTESESGLHERTHMLSFPRKGHRNDQERPEHTWCYCLILPAACAHKYKCFCIH